MLQCCFDTVVWVSGRALTCKSLKSASSVFWSTDYICKFGVWVFECVCHYLVCGVLLILILWIARCTSVFFSVSNQNQGLLWLVLNLTHAFSLVEWQKGIRSISFETTYRPPTCRDKAVTSQIPFRTPRQTILCACSQCMLEMSSTSYNAGLCHSMTALIKTLRLFLDGWHSSSTYFIWLL